MQLKKLFKQRFLRDERGQSAVIVAVTIAAMLAVAGTSVETGHVYYAYRLLVASTNSATLAGAQVMPDTTTATTYVNNYSSKTGKMNATPFLTNVAVTPSFLCLNTVKNTLGIACLTSTGASGGYNAISVRQTATVNLWLGGLLGLKKMNIAAVSTAAIKGGTNTPWNVAILLDTTQSMASSDSGAQCTGTQESCALQGVRYLLNDLYPCDVGQTCTSSGANNVDSVSLFVFPAIQTSSAQKEYCSSSGSVSISDYVVPAMPTSASYQLSFGGSSWSNDYRADDKSTTGLNSSSNVVKAAGGSGGCSGVQAPGGAGTYYAQAIYSAQAALISQQTANPGSQNALIILSDGNATATATITGHATGGGANPANYASDSQLAPSTTGGLNGVLGNNPTSYTYPSALGECGQAVVAAQTAASAGTAVYTIGYGAPILGGCLSDLLFSPSVTTGGGTWGPGNQPCQALAAMASKPSNFYSDDGAGCVATSPSNASITQLTAIFTAITHNFTNARLIPNGTT
jgi:Flp pilus assembly protein TadG